MPGVALGHARQQRLDPPTGSARDDRARPDASDHLTAHRQAPAHPHDQLCRAQPRAAQRCGGRAVRACELQPEAGSRRAHPDREPSAPAGASPVRIGDRRVYRGHVQRRVPFQGPRLLCRRRVHSLQGPGARRGCAWSGGRSGHHRRGPPHRRRLQPRAHSSRRRARRSRPPAARSGRRRLHPGGQLLAGAARRWRDRGGGAVWSFTHIWREVPREAWGAISVLASVEQPEDIQAARAVGYAAAIVVDKFPSDEAFFLPRSITKIVPCPAETRDKTCVECRLCLDADTLARRNIAIAFEAHGPTARRVREALVQQRVLVVEKSRADRSRGQRAR